MLLPGVLWPGFNVRKDCVQRSVFTLPQPNHFLVKRISYLIPALLGCTSSSPKGDALSAGFDSAWTERVRASACHRTALATSNWPEFLTARGQVTIRIPPFLPQDRYQAASESAKAGGKRQFPPSASGWNNLQTGRDVAQLGVGVEDSVKLAYPGRPEPDESICIERIDGAQATILSSNRGATTANSQRTALSGDSVGPLGPYIVFATMRFPDGLSLKIFGTATTPDQQNQMLAAIRTIRRFSNR